ncbi:PRD domain-containing protein [Mycoplasma todarodis]|uniref:PRD domain-containing protein n=1 Tax=Mycoplasma todarodis TaxID=1937191 RepID=UPI003B2BDAB0
MNRLKILLKANVIDQEIYDTCSKIESDCKNWPQDDKERFITHLAMALSRIKKGEKVDPMSPMIANELKSNQNFNEAETNLKEMLIDFDYPIVEDEKMYLMLHILNNFNN